MHLMRPGFPPVAVRNLPSGPEHRALPDGQGLDRRNLLKSAGLASAGLLIGSVVPFGRSPVGALLAGENSAAQGIAGKEGLAVLSTSPICAETPAHLLDDPITPTSRHFVRNNGSVPEMVDPEDWNLEIHGLVERPAKFRIGELRSRFEVITRQLVLECAGNGRAFFEPQVSGCQWSLGAVACSEWTGVRLADILQFCGVRRDAVYTAHEGADTLLTGEKGGMAISRGIPVFKAMDPGNLVAFAMNGRPLHPLHGAPLRLLVPGWPGSCSQKWLTRIGLIDRVHDGRRMTGHSYRVPAHPVLPGTEVPAESMEIIHAMPVKSLITSIAAGSEIDERVIDVAGHAWAGERTVADVEVSVDRGATWMTSELQPPRNAHAWQRWKATVSFPSKGHHEIWARATDDRGSGQPFAISWNPKGYLNNSVHRVPVQVVG